MVYVSFFRRPVPQGYPHVRECDLATVRRPASSQFVPRDRSKPRVLSYLFRRNSVLPTNQVNCRDPTCLRVAVQGTDHVREGALRSRKYYSAGVHKIRLDVLRATKNSSSLLDVGNRDVRNDRLVTDVADRLRTSITFK